MEKAGEQKVMCAARRRALERTQHMVRHLSPAVVVAEEVAPAAGAAEGAAGPPGMGGLAGIPMWGWMLAAGLGMQYFGSKKEKPPTQATHRNQQEALQESLGFSPEKMKEIDALMEDYVKKKQMPGMVVSITKGGHLVYNKAHGDAVKEDSIFDVASLQKGMVGAMVLSLVDEGVFALDTPVSDYIPSFANFKVHTKGAHKADLETEPLRRPITLKDLLNHTWGYPGYDFLQSGDKKIVFLDGLAAAVGDPTTGDDPSLWDKLAEVPLYAQPGESFRYGIGTGIAGIVAARATGKPLHELMQDRVFGPCGMVDTKFWVSAEDRARVCPRYEVVPGYVGTWGKPFYSEYYRHTSWLGWQVAEVDSKLVPIATEEHVRAQGLDRRHSLYSTASDVMRFQAMLLAKGVAADGARVLTEAAVDAMTSNSLLGSLGVEGFNTHAKDKADSPGLSPIFGVNAPGQGVGLGPLWTVEDTFTSRIAGNKASYSALGMLGTEWWNDPTHELCVFVGAQVMPFNAYAELRQELAAIVYGALLPPAAAKMYRNTAVGEQGGGMQSMMMNMMMMMMMMPGMGGGM